MASSEQEYVKKSLLSEIEENFLKGSGHRRGDQVCSAFSDNNFLVISCTPQKNTSSKASETSERDFALPLSCLRKAMDCGVDSVYDVKKVN